ncbi:hypothetical protein [Oceanospirillum linum]|nr:hypothetical protein [Oceanospirillum linum]SEG38530.1 hypothetical protein SAMN04489856_10978 [Oleiphilus messinensis]SMP32060.1 hypothetical protein SAMN06264348_10951 [Oceanospirillum linum]
MAHAESHDYETIGVGATLLMAAAGLVLGIFPVLTQIWVLLN